MSAERITPEDPMGAVVARDELDEDEVPTPRPSGILPRAERARSDAPTVPPPPRPSGPVARTISNAPVDELLYRFDMGDHKGALAAAESLLDEDQVPVCIVPDELLAYMALDHREAFLLSFIDGHTSFQAVVRGAGMPLLEALRILCELLEKRVVALRPRSI